MRSEERWVIIAVLVEVASESPKVFGLVVAFNKLSGGENGNYRRKGSGCKCCI